MLSEVGILISFLSWRLTVEAQFGFEAIRRKPLKQETETYVTLAGVAVMVP